MAAPSLTVPWSCSQKTSEKAILFATFLLEQSFLTFVLTLPPSFQICSHLQSASRIYSPVGCFSSVFSPPYTQGEALGAGFVTVQKARMRGISSLSSTTSWEEQNGRSRFFQRCAGKGGKTMGTGCIKARSGCSERLCHFHSWRHLKSTGECPEEPG